MRPSLRLNNKSKFLLNNISTRKYSTRASAASASSLNDRLNTIIKELGLNPVYIFKNLERENTRK